MKCLPPSPSRLDLGALEDEFEFTPDLDELATGLAVYGAAPRLRIFALLDRSKEICVCDIARVLRASVSAVSQHLAKLRAHRLVKFRRDGQTLYYALTDHPLNAVVRRSLAEAHPDVGE